jgi:hypothetical protein
MTQRFYIPKARVFTNDGVVGAGYKLYFYITATSTLKDTYSDSGMSIANTNPVVADSSGYFTDIFLSDDSYKVVLTDENDVIIWTADPQDIFTISLNTLEVRPYTHWGTTSGTTIAYTLSPNPALSAYLNTLRFSMTMNATNTASSTLAIENLNDLGNFLTAKTIKKYDGTGAKTDLEAGDLILARTYDVYYDGTNFIILNPSLPFIDLTNSINFPFLDDNFISGMIPSSTVATPDTSIDITAGKCLAKDGITILYLDSAESALNMETVLTTALSADTSYHLFYFKKTKATAPFWEYKWSLQTTTTPTITDIYSANCYRRIGSFITDANADIYQFYCYDERGILRYEYVSKYIGTIAAAASFPTLAAVRTGWTYKITSNVTDNDATKTNTNQSFVDGACIAWNGTNWSNPTLGGIRILSLTTTNLPETPTDLVVKVPTGLKSKMILQTYMDVGNGADRILFLLDKNSNRVQSLIQNAPTAQRTQSVSPFIYSDASSKIQYFVSVADGNTTLVVMNIIGFYDERLIN